MTIEDPRIHDSPALAPSLRWIANTLCLPKLCRRARCSRAGACHGEPRQCLTRYARLVPEEAREGVEAMIEGLHNRLSFEEVHDEAPEEIEALAAWQERVNRMSRR